MKTFISYSSNSKKASGKIKEYLDQFGFNCFLAHEDIPPQTKWPTKILRELKQCDLFLPILTSGFIESFFCQQETGYAYCSGVEILPIMVSKAPMGMIADLQAIKFNKNNFDLSCWRIVKHVAGIESLSAPVLDSLIEWFGKSSRYDVANERAKKILNEFDFSPNQVKKIKKHIKRNSQIHETKYARNTIFKFMDRYPKYFNDGFRDWYDSRRVLRMHMRY